MKCSGLWKTVIGPLASVEASPVAEPLVEVLEWPLAELSGEMGMVLSGTGSLPLTAVVMMTDVDGIRMGRGSGWLTRERWQVDLGWE